jgi:hypothetical protein
MAKGRACVWSGTDDGSDPVERSPHELRQIVERRTIGLEVATERIRNAPAPPRELPEKRGFSARAQGFEYGEM